MTLAEPSPPNELRSPTATEAPAPPKPLPATLPVPLPENRRYRFKRRILGPPLHSDQLENERLGKPTALAVFASDALSSTSYATEEIIHVLVPAIGLLAFSSYVMPISLAMAGVLVILVFSYRQTIKAYPSAGGAYIVTKDNLGVLPAQVAGVALLTGYILTVAVSVSAGAAALYAAFPALYPVRVPLAVSFIALIALANLRGVRESGRLFAVPTYAFVLAIFTMIAVGLAKSLTTGLDELPLPDHSIEIGSGGVGLFLILNAFSRSGAAVTGVEAISNGVPAFKKPEWRNARTTLSVMGGLLAAMFLGISYLAVELRAVPGEKSTVISRIARGVFGESAFGSVAFFTIQAVTVFILILAANTSFADFPRLASFAAGDSFMPKQLTKRGHRLVFSNGILSLAVVSAILVALFGADVTRLIPLYAIGVFTSFTLSQAGMAKHHLRLREPRWRIGLLINGTGAAVTAGVAVIAGIVNFAAGAWFIMVLVPVMVFFLFRLNRQYRAETDELESEARAAAEAPILRRHTVLVLVDELDRSTARAIQYARTLVPDELRAIHIATDLQAAGELSEEWQRLGLQRLPLELVECPDRRIERAVLQVVAEDVADGNTEVSVLIPRLEYRSLWHRLLHDNTAESIASALANLPHANVTFVPYHLGEHIPVAQEVPGSRDGRR